MTARTGMGSCRRGAGDAPRAGRPTPPRACRTPTRASASSLRPERHRRTPAGSRCSRGRDTPRPMDETEEVVAVAALERYDLDVVRCEPLATSYNTLFRVDTADGSRYALRMSPARRVHRDGSDEAEASWLDALHRDGVVTAPRFVRSRDGAARVDVSSRRCALMTWVEGRRLDDDPTPAGIREMGALAARLHGHRTTPVAHSSVPAFARVVYWALDVRFDELTPAQRSVVDPALARARAAIDALWSAPRIPPQLL